MKKIITQIVIGILITVSSAAIIGGLLLYTSYHIHIKEYNLYKNETKTDNSILNRKFDSLTKEFKIKNRGVNHRIDNLIDNNSKQHQQLRQDVNNILFVIKENNKKMKQQLELLLQQNSIDENGTGYSPTVTANN